MRFRRGRGRANSPTERRAATVVEFAFVVPVAFLFVFGLVEIGRIIMVQQALTHAARHGCRTATLATTTDTADVDAAVRTCLQGVIRDALDANKVQVQVAPTSLSGISAGTPITVRAEASFSDSSWLTLGCLGFGDDWVVAAEATHERE